MEILDSDTICAIATSPGRSGVGIIRISGDEVGTIAEAVLRKLPEARKAHYGDFLAADGEVLDQGIAIYFKAPHSFTGEDVLELQGHGGPYVLNSILQRVQALGARLARPGEFTERAFINDKMDLLQAEAIADLIDANSRQAARSAMRTLKGEFSQRIHKLVADLVKLRVNIEAAIDFSDEDIDVLADTAAHENLEKISRAIAETLETAEQGAILMQGINVVLAGAPNAGKSSLLNILSGQDSAIVTEIPGTTRDLLSSQIMLGDLPVHITDTAGLRESDDRVEQEGVKRARSAIQESDLLLLIVDAADPAHSSSSEVILAPLLALTESHNDLADLLAKTVVVSNKIDLLNEAPGKDSLSYQELQIERLKLSAKQQHGLDLLTALIQDRAGLQAGAENVFVARERHIRALGAARDLLDSAMGQLQENAPLELAAEDLRLAQQRLGEITGEFSSDDLLGEIFSQFCLGK